MRGQAWIIFEDISSATSAQRAEHGFSFFGKKLKVVYAREKSDRIAKKDGTYVPKDRRAQRGRSHQPTSTAMQSMLSHSANVAVCSTASDNSSAILHQGTASNIDPAAHDPPLSSEVPPPPPPPEKDQGIQTNEEMTSMHSEQTVAPPSNILFAQDLPSECNEMMLAMLFRQYLGYKEVRIPRQGLAFIEFDDEPHATLALRGLNGFQLTTSDTLNLKYGKKSNEA